MSVQEKNDALAQKVVTKMMREDAFSQWLGIRVIEIREGYARLQMNLRDEMLNGFGVIHGGLAFSLADSAFAFACNNRNNLSLALDTSITFTKATRPGDVLIAEAKERNDALKEIIQQHLDAGQMVVAMAGGGGNSLDEWLRAKFQAARARSQCSGHLH